MTPAKRRNPCTGKPIGESWWASKYTDREVRQVWLLRWSGYSVRAISEKLDMPRSTVGDIVAGRRGGLTERNGGSHDGED